MDVFICGEDTEAKRTIAKQLEAKGHEVGKAQSFGFSRRAEHNALHAVYTKNGIGTSIRFVLDEAGSFRRAAHPNFTVLLRSTASHLPQAQQHSTSSGATTARNVGTDCIHARLHGSLPATRDFYRPRYDLIVDIYEAGPIKAARIIEEGVRAFWSDSYCGIRGPFCNDDFWLSNMFAVSMDFEGITYSCSESAYQAQKTEDEAIRTAVSNLDGKSAKRFMEGLTPRHGWGNDCVDVMERVLLAKFSQNGELRKKLISTTGQYLCELNDWSDEFFGVTINIDGSVGHGLNMLGKALMRVRNTLRVPPNSHVQPL